MVYIDTRAGKKQSLSDLSHHITLTTHHMIFTPLSIRFMKAYKAYVQSALSRRLGQTVWPYPVRTV